MEAKIGTKQQIWNFVGLVSLQRMGAINKKFTIQLDTPNQLELKRLSELPDFDKYLTVEEYPFGDFMLDVTTYKGYTFYPKDALVK